MFLMFSLLTSGCVSDTGQVTKHTTSLAYTEPQNTSQAPSNSMTSQVQTNITTTTQNRTQATATTTIQTTAHTTPLPPQQPEQQPQAQNTRSLKPQDTAPNETQTCDITCPQCTALNADKCECETVLFCDGNGICEEGEYSNSRDCPECDDGDANTMDTYNYTTKHCVHVPRANTIGDTNQTHNISTSEENKTQTIIITEIMYDSLERYDQHGEFIEIYNPTGREVNLSGWRIRDSKKEDNLTSGSGDYILKPGQHAVITGTNSTVELTEEALHLVTGHKVICSYGLSNKGENITLLYPDATPSDSLDYSTLPKCDPGHSLERKNNTWSCSTKEGGTPGY